MDYNSEQAILQRYQWAKGQWELWRLIYDEAYSYANPDRNPWPEGQWDGVKKNINVYDITACNSSRRLVSRLHSSLMPSDMQWFELEAGEEVTDPAERKALNAQLQDFGHIIFKTLSDSNFALASYEMLEDLIIGTGAMMALEHPGDVGVKFKTIPINRVYPEGDAWDEINTVWRDFLNMDGRDINGFWPNASITDTMQVRMMDDECARFDFIEGVIYDPERNDYRHIVMECAGKEYILDIRTPSSPWIVARWSKTSREVGGRGPVIEALPTIRSLNRLVEDILSNVALSSCPPWMASSDGVFNPYLFTIEPNKIIPVSRASMGDLPLKKLDVSGDIQLGTLEINDLRQSIKDCLYDNPVRPVDAPEQTATEIMIRQQQFLEEIGPAFGRLSSELLPKIINRVIYILQRRGKLPKQLIIDNKTISMRFKSPLLRGQNVQEIKNLQNYVQIMQSVLGPQMTIGTMNLDMLPQWLCDQLDVDETLIKSPLEIQQLVAQMQNAANPPQTNPAQGSNQLMASQAAIQANSPNNGQNTAPSQPQPNPGNPQ